MKDRTWTLTMSDTGRTYKGISQQDAVIALQRMVYGMEPFGELAAVESRRAPEPVEARRLAA